MAGRKNRNKKDWEEPARKTEADLQLMQAELADANQQLAGATSADPDSEASLSFPFQTLTAVIKQAILTKHMQVRLTRWSRPLLISSSSRLLLGVVLLSTNMQDVKLLDVASMNAADFKSWKQTWDDYYKVNKIENCPPDVRMAAFRLMCTLCRVATPDKVILMSPSDDRRKTRSGSLMS